MKTRMGFVSNSSSSSFIVGFRKVPASVLEMQAALFASDAYFVSPYDKYRWATTEIAQIVFDDMMRQDPLTRSGIFEEMKTGYFEGQSDDYYDYSIYDTVEGETQEQRWKRINEFNTWRNKILDDDATRALGRFYASELTYFVFEYSDNDGALGTAMEHGGLFRRLPHFVVSHH